MGCFCGDLFKLKVRSARHAAGKAGARADVGGFNGHIPLG
jgi:hypothetical protein